MKQPDQKPSSLFRYQSLINIKFLEPILLQNQLYAAFLGEGGFNDPCEAFYSMQISWDEQACRQRIRLLKHAMSQSTSWDAGMRARQQVGIISREEETAALRALLTMTEDQ
jgi:hypothetical protein